MDCRPKLLILSPSCEGWPEWPVGMAYVLACLEEHEFDFDFIDVVTTPDWGNVVINLMQRNDYYAIATGGMISFVSFYTEVARLTAQHAKGTPFVLGGHIVKDGSNELLFDTIGADFAILGEAEVAMPAFLRALQQGETDFTGYDGVVFRNAEGTIVRTRQKRFRVADKNILPAWHHFDCAYYIEHCKFCFLGENLRYMPIMSGRGCTGNCGFCSPSIGGFMKRPIEHVIEEIKHLIAHYDFENLCFLNEMFYPKAEMIREFCSAYMRLEKRKTWFVQIRADLDIDVETLSLMKQAGCIAISAGIESGSNDILRTMNKGTTTEQIRRLARCCREANLPLTGTFIVGYTNETAEDIRKTIDLVVSEDISSGEALLFIYPGTAVYKEALRRGAIKNEAEQIQAISGELFRPNAPQEFCNLTAMSTQEFFTVVPNEIRKYNKYLFEKYSVENLTFSIEKTWRWTEIRLHGRCDVCKIEVEYSYKVFGGEFLGSLGPGVNRMVICPLCFKYLIYNLYSAKNDMGMRKHLQEIRKQLSKAKKVLIYGVGANLHFLLRSDLYDLDYEGIQGIHSPAPFPYDHYLTYPMLDEEAFCRAEADCIICVDDSVPQRKIEELYQARGREAPPVVYLTSEEFRKELSRKRCLVYKINQLTKRIFGRGLRDILNIFRRQA